MSCVTCILQIPRTYNFWCEDNSVVLQGGGCDYDIVSVSQKAVVKMRGPEIRALIEDAEKFADESSAPNMFDNDVDVMIPKFEEPIVSAIVKFCEERPETPLYKQEDTALTPWDAEFCQFNLPTWHKPDGIWLNINSKPGQKRQLPSPGLTSTSQVNVKLTSGEKPNQFILCQVTDMKPQKDLVRVIPVHDDGFVYYVNEYGYAWQIQESEISTLHDKTLKKMTQASLFFGIAELDNLLWKCKTLSRC